MSKREVFSYLTSFKAELIKATYSHTITKTYTSSNKLTQVHTHRLTAHATNTRQAGRPHMQLDYGCDTERLQKACAVMENVCFAPHLSGARGQRWHMEPVSIPASTSEEGWNYLCCEKSVLAFVSPHKFTPSIHHHNISSPLHLSYALHILSKSVAELETRALPRLSQRAACFTLQAYFHIVFC